MAEQVIKPITQAIVLCVDLDGTLVNTNTLHEAFVAACSDLSTLLAIPAWLRAGGKARLKQELAQRAQLDPLLLPYNEALLTYLRAQKCAGRSLVLVTAADRSIAEAVAAHLGLFDAIIASEHGRNLGGGAKVGALVARFGEEGFAYAGNDKTDLAIWRKAASAVVVNGSASLAQAAAGLVPVEIHINRQPAPVRTLLRALRSYQWIKNLLVFIPILTANAFRNLDEWFSALLLLIAFCAVASSIYLLNDLTDLAADRKHPRKKARPLASGDLSISSGLVLLPLLFLTSIIISSTVGVKWIICLYFIISAAYSFWLKEVALADIFVLTSLYTLRLFAGGEVTGHTVSPWLLAFSSFFFFSLAIIKRVSELMLQSDKMQAIARRGYVFSDIQILQLMGVSASFSASLVLALYVRSPEIKTHYARPELLWGLVPLILFWLCYMWLVTSRGSMHDDPIVYASMDWISRLMVVLIFSLLVAACL